MDQQALSQALLSLQTVMSRLRGPEGCPWDLKQTDASVKVYLLEEAFEVAAAIEQGSPDEVCSELGDLLFQILFLAQLASERGEFDLTRVIERILEKMIRRHPHIFQGESVNSAEEVVENWARIKRAERGGSGPPSSLLRNVPAGMPALLRAHRLGERAARYGFDWPGPLEIWQKVEEEMEELGQAMAEADPARVTEELGDLFFSLVHLARHWGENAENLLRKANEKFLDRFEKMENHLRAAGVSLEQASPEQLDTAWETIKRSEGHDPS